MKSSQPISPRVTRSRAGVSAKYRYSVARLTPGYFAMSFPADAEVRAMEIKLILENGANDPEIGYNLSPRWLG